MSPMTLSACRRVCGQDARGAGRRMRAMHVRACVPGRKGNEYFRSGGAEMRILMSFGAFRRT